MLLSIISFTTLALSRAAAANPETAVSRAITAADALQTWYNRATGIWDTCGWWNGANCMTTLADLANLKLNDSVNGMAKDVFQNTFSVAPNSNPYPERGIDADYTSVNGTSYSQTLDKKVPTGATNALLWLDGSYDDDAWWGLAWVAAYDATGQTDYLDLAEGIFYHLCGNGGIDSDYTHVYVGAVANELYLALAAQLANLWTYNQGIILGGLVELNCAVDNETSSNSTYLREAQKIAMGAIAALTDDDHVFHEPCEPDSCGADQTQFKGIFMRNLRLLHEVAPNDTYAQVVNASARSLWANDRTDENQFGVDWSVPVDSAKVNASTQSSALDALVAAIWK
ncbi:Six-hairpin glycosidase-like protein [Aspergillus spinulosporus]